MTIDTDKYEGHTPAPWRIGDEEIEDEGWADLLSGPWRVCGLTGLAKQDDPDAQLIVDAPLLFAEVKRLRKQVVALLHENERLEAMYHMDVHGDDTLTKLLERKK